MRSVTCFTRIGGAQGNFHIRGEVSRRLSKKAHKQAARNARDASGQVDFSKGYGFSSLW
jgi:hypothetical protein